MTKYTEPCRKEMISLMIREALLALDREKNPFNVVETESNIYFKLDAELFQALWFLDYNIVHENNLYFLTNSNNKQEVLHLKPVTLSNEEGEFVELEFKITEAS